MNNSQDSDFMSSLLRQENLGQSNQIRQRFPNSHFYDLQDQDSFNIDLFLNSPSNKMVEESKNDNYGSNVALDNLNAPDTLDDKIQRQKHTKKNSKKNQKQEKSKQNYLEQRKRNSKKYRQKKKNLVEQILEQNKRYKQLLRQYTAKIFNLEEEIYKLKFDKSAQKFDFEEKQLRDQKQFLKRKKQMNHADIVAQGIQLKSKYGPAGTVRAQMLNYNMCQFMNNILSDSQKYLFISCIKKRGIFGQEKTNLDKILMKQFKFSTDKQSQSFPFKKFLNRKNADDLTNLISKYLQKSKQMYKSYIDILQQAQKLQKFIRNQDTQNAIQINQIFQIFFWFNQNKYRPEVVNLREQWYRLLRGEL